VDEMLRRAAALVEGMTFDREQMARNLARYGPFAATERVLVAAVRAGADRQEAHEWLRELSLRAWEAIRREEPNPLLTLVVEDNRLKAHLGEAEIRELMNAEGFTGTASTRARELATEIRRVIA
jgi:adenylosuccinate lyase